MSWQKVKLGDVCRIFSGFAFKSEMFNESGDGLPLIRIGDVGRNSTKIFYSGPYQERYLMDDGDILVSLSGDFYSCCWSAGKALLNQRVCRLEPAIELDANFLLHALPDLLMRLEEETSAFTIKNLSVKNLADTKIPLPPLAEQKRLAAILDRADDLRRVRRQVLAGLDELAQSLFLELFGDPATNPKGWDVAALKSIGKITTGATPPSASTGMFGGDIPFVTPGDLGKDESANRTLTESGAGRSRVVREGSTLVCCIGATIGKFGMVKQRSAFNQQINAVEWNETIEDNYGFAALRFCKSEIAQRGASTTLPILKKSLFEKIEIPLPPLELQQKFAAQIEELEAVKARARASLLELDALFASLQSRAFAGELSGVTST